MKNIKTLSNSLLILTVIFFNGCSSSFHFKSFEAENSQAVLKELISRRESIEAFQGKAEVEIIAPQGTFRVKCNLSFNDNSGWDIKVLGPFGILLAEIETDSDEYLVRYNNGSSLTGRLDESFVIPGANIILPNLFIITGLLFPIIDIKQQDKWKIISSDVSSPGELILEKKISNVKETLELKLDFSPLKIYSTQLYIDDKSLYMKSFTYSESSKNEPALMEIQTPDVTLKVEFKSLSFVKKASDLASGKELL